MIETKVSGAHMKVFTDFSKYGVKVRDAVSEELDAIALDVVSGIKKAMRRTKKQSKTVGKRGHHPSVAGFPPAVDSGHLRDNIEILRTGDTVEVGSNVKYGAYLQTGTKRGLKARPWLEPGLDSVDITMRMSAAIRRAFKK
jgi:phage gpG-like protein